MNKQADPNETESDQTGSDGSWSAEDLAAPLAPLRFLEGTWISEGTGPYGPYTLNCVAAVRGRWLLLTYEIRGSGSDEIFYYSTQVYGYDGDGLLLQLFDTAGAFKFRGVVAADGSVRFDWSDGHERRRSQFNIDEAGGLAFLYEHVVPEDDEPTRFEGPWRRV